MIPIRFHTPDTTPELCRASVDAFIAQARANRDIALGLLLYPEHLSRQGHEYIRLGHIPNLSHLSISIRAAHKAAIIALVTDRRVFILKDRFRGTRPLAGDGET